jgi:hypothetical protein
MELANNINFQTVALYYIRCEQKLEIYDINHLTMFIIKGKK